MTETRIDIYDEAHCCECAVCGGHRTAYSYPPVCAGCRDTWEIEVEFNRWAKDQTNYRPARGLMDDMDDKWEIWP